MENSQGQVTLLLERLSKGDKEAHAELIPLVYKELRRIAGYYMRDERAGHTLQPTALVNEVYLRLLDQTSVEWRNRAHFLGVSAQLMRRILVDHARRRVASKHGGRRVRVQIEHFDIADLSENPEQVLAIDEAVSRLKAFDPRQGTLIEMRYFGGLTVDETAHALGISPRTAKREWTMARAWLEAELAAKTPGL